MVAAQTLRRVRSEVQAWFIGSERDVDPEGFHGEDPIGLMRAIFPTSSM